MQGKKRQLLSETITSRVTVDERVFLDEYIAMRGSNISLSRLQREAIFEMIRNEYDMITLLKSKESGNQALFTDLEDLLKEGVSDED